MNKLIITIITITGLAISINAGNNSPLSIDEIVLVKDKLQKIAQQTQTINSSFVQTKHLTILSEKIVSRGKFFYKKENRIRWEYIKPYKYTIIFSNYKIHIDNEGKKNTIDMQSNAVFKEINNMILGSIRGDIIQEQSTYKLEYNKDRLFIIIRLTPLSTEIKKYVGHIEIFFNKKDFQVSRVNIIELSGDYTNIVFTHKKINSTLPDKIFTID